MKAIPSIFSVIAMFAMAPAAVQAAEIQTPLTDEELTLRPGDTITWSPSSVHRIRFGGKVRSNTLKLPSFDDVKTVLKFAPITPPFEVAGDVAKAGQAQKVVATVKANAHTAGVPELFFTCGFNDTHANDMVTVSFKFDAPLQTPGQPRNVEIITTNDPPAPNHRFLLRTAAGEKSLTKKP